MQPARVLVYGVEELPASSFYGCRALPGVTVGPQQRSNSTLHFCARFAHGFSSSSIPILMCKRTLPRTVQTCIGLPEIVQYTALLAKHASLNYSSS